jgi:hypothetical protein
MECAVIGTRTKTTKLYENATVAHGLRIDNNGIYEYTYYGLSRGEIESVFPNQVQNQTSN